ncbi:hypothetical protein EDB85DRAFT_2033989 [Lactarius pseudohatsudake]|nr:hypothetical protein EDB85DRAFT_2033989 [Lactarius pseudohatsudake]
MSGQLPSSFPLSFPAAQANRIHLPSNWRFQCLCMWEYVVSCSSVEDILRRCMRKYIPPSFPLCRTSRSSNSPFSVVGACNNRCRDPLSPEHGEDESGPFCACDRASFDCRAPLGAPASLPPAPGAPLASPVPAENSTTPKEPDVVPAQPSKHRRWHWQNRTAAVSRAGEPPARLHDERAGVGIVGRLDNKEDDDIKVCRRVHIAQVEGNRLPSNLG